MLVLICIVLLFMFYQLKGFVFWILKTAVAGLILSVDYILYKILIIIKTHGKMEIQQDG